MPTTAPVQRHGRGRPGRLGARVSRVVRERRRLRLIKEQVEAAFALDMAELRHIYGARIAHIEAQLRELDHGVMPQPARRESE